ncbi:MAG: hypothetical protein JF606_23905 [Burkholderiales bacterium]|nr:hypothetical protein [Burkholderiales bacterium]
MGRITEPFVLRRVEADKVVIGATHPVLGPVYWHFTDGSDCNSADFYSLTTSAEGALRLQRGWRNKEYLFSRWRSFMSRMIIDNTIELDYELHGPLREDDECELRVIDARLTNHLAELERDAAGAPGAFCEWLDSAQWLDLAAPHRLLFLEDMNSLVGYGPRWTEEPSRARTFSKAKIDGSDLEVDLIFKEIGHFVPLSEALACSPTGNSTVPHSGRSMLKRTQRIDFEWLGTKLKYLTRR